MRTADARPPVSLRIPAYAAAYPVAGPRAPAPPVEAAGSATHHYPDRPGSQLPVERILEGEVLPRPAAADVVLADPRVLLDLRTTRVLDDRPAPPATGMPTAVLFYLLHSSNEQLAAGTPGRNVDQRV